MGLDFLCDGPDWALDDEQALLYLTWQKFVAPEYHRELLDLIFKKGVNRYAINSGEYYKKDNHSASESNFALNVYVLATYPETFKILKENNIGIWHGSNGNGIASTLEHGLVASAFHEENKITANFGEKELTKHLEWGGVRSYISASADLRVAMNYAAMNLVGPNADETSFPVVYGMTEADCKELGGLAAYSDISEEVKIKTAIVPPEKIKFIGVPPEKVDYVKMLVGEREIEVGALDLPVTRGFSRYFSPLSLLESGKRLSEFEETKETVPIQEPDLKVLAKNRFIDKIKIAYNDFKKRISAKCHKRGGREENER